MTWVFIVLGLVVVALLGVWWLERPLWYECDGVRSLENFLRDLISPRHPYPNMYVVARPERCQLHFSRSRIDDSTFHLGLTASFKGADEGLAHSMATKLEASHFSGDQISIAAESSENLNLRIDFRRSGGSTLSEATQASRIILEQLGVRNSLGSLQRADGSGRCTARTAECGAKGRAPYAFRGQDRTEAFRSVVAYRWLRLLGRKQCGTGLHRRLWVTRRGSRRAPCPARAGPFPRDARACAARGRARSSRRRA